MTKATQELVLRTDELLAWKAKAEVALANHGVTIH